MDYFKFFLEYYYFTELNGVFQVVNLCLGQGVVGIQNWQSVSEHLCKKIHYAKTYTSQEGYIGELK